MIIDENWNYADYVYTPGKYDSINNPNKLHESFIGCKHNVGWKASVQRYELSELSNIVRIIDSMEDETYEMADPYEFEINERGHKRHIKALTILDRVIQRSFNDNVLTPAVVPHLIYDNGASQKGKGVSFSRNRFKYHLQSAYYEFGYNGWILFIDFSKYFDNILHDRMLEQFKPFMTEAEYAFLENTFHSFDVDVTGYLSDEEFMTYKDDLFNMLEYANNVDKSLLTGEKMMEKSVGIGNQTSQASGIYYAHSIDNYCKIVKGIKYYGRYMDDTYIIARTKEELYQILHEIEAICEPLGIHINMKKTRIQPLYTDMSYLKITYKILKTGRILEIVPKKIFKRELNMLKKFKRLYEAGKMPIVDIIQCFLSWEGSYKKFDSKFDVHNMNKIFRMMFNIPFENEDLHEVLHYLLKWEKEKTTNKRLLNEY